MHRLSIALLSPLALAGCHDSGRRTDADPNDKSIHIAMDANDGDDHLSVTIPGFDAKVALPSMNFGRHVDLDGIRLAPDTQVSDMDIAGKEHDGGGDGQGRVVLNFTSPEAPARLVDFYRRSAAEAGFDVVRAGQGTLTATKKDKRFALAVSPAGGGSHGTITINGGGR